MDKCEHLNSPIRITLPEDAGLHPLSNIEWWYCYGFLYGDKGSKYAAIASFFSFGEMPCFKGHYIIFSIIDMDKNVHRSYSFIDGKGLANFLFYIPYSLFYNPANKRLWKLYANLLGCKLPYPHNRMKDVLIQLNPLHLGYGDNSLSFSNQLSHQFKLSLVGEGIKINLQFSPKKPITLVGNTGKPNRLYYYSFSRNNLYGHIERDGSMENVIGEGWFDHQWGRDYKLTFNSGWDWFGIQLVDGRELLMNQFFNIENKKNFCPMANLIESNGSLKFTRNVKYYPLKYWKSPLTEAVYPLEWNILIPDFNMRLYVRPRFIRQEMPILGHIQAIWEGACMVTGEETSPGQQKVKPLIGNGFMELVGYANRS
jgi:predicted secreted hydrolase